MMTRLLLPVLLCVFAIYPAELTRQPLSITFVPPISTYGRNGPNTVSDVSFNIIGGYIGSVRAFELGGVFNIVRFDLRGCQVAGVVNVVRGGVRGCQLAPVNIAVTGLRGAQLGFVNITRDIRPGVQLGVINVAADLNGLQLGNININSVINGLQAGNVNIASDINGFQAGNVNITSDINGLKVGNVNISGRHSGLVVGNVNIAGSAAGLMVGNVNICSHLDGEALGNISIIGNGYRALSLWTDETGTVQVGGKLGSRHIYNVFGLGSAALADPGPRWFFTYGAGAHLPLKNRLFLDLDAVACFISEPSSLRRARGERLFRFRPQLGFAFSHRVSALAGPVFSLRITNEEADDRLTPIRAGLIEGWLRQNKTWYQAWPGLMLGLQLN